MPRSNKQKPLPEDSDGIKAREWFKATSESLSKKAAARMKTEVSKQKARNAVSRMKKDMKKKGIKPRYDYDTWRMERDIGEWSRAANDKTK